MAQYDIRLDQPLGHQPLAHVIQKLLGLLRQPSCLHCIHTEPLAVCLRVSQWYVSGISKCPVLLRATDAWQSFSVSLSQDAAPLPAPSHAVRKLWWP